MAYTFDKDLAVDTLELIKETLLTVMRRTSHINTVDDFYASEVGMILLDSVCMKLVAVGASVKNLDKITNKSLLENYPEINWKDIMGMRDIIVHHYFDIDATIVVATLRNEIPQLYRVIELIIEDLI